jgi:hypothetical protein
MEWELTTWLLWLLCAAVALWSTAVDARLGIAGLALAIKFTVGAYANEFPLDDAALKVIYITGNAAAIACIGHARQRNDSLGLQLAGGALFFSIGVHITHHFLGLFGVNPMAALAYYSLSNGATALAALGIGWATLVGAAGGMGSGNNRVSSHWLRRFAAMDSRREGQP